MDKFYLKKIFNDPEKVFSFSYSPFEDIKDECIYVLDTNILLVPYLTSKSGLNDIKRILRYLKENDRLIIPARVAREFAKNRGSSLANIYKKIQEALERAGKLQLNLGNFPILEDNEDYKDAKNLQKSITTEAQEYREKLKNIKEQIVQWNWNDPVSTLYREIITEDIIIEVEKSEEDLKKDLKFRQDHDIAPGYEDSGKIDDGIGDIIIWNTILELGNKKDSDITFVTNEKKPDWFYSEYKTALYPKFELFDEFRNKTNGNCINIVGFEDFLISQDAEEETIKEIKDIYASTGYLIINKEEFMDHLKDCLEEAKSKPNGFVSSKFFVETYLAERDYDIGHSWELFNSLQKKGVIEVYKHVDPDGVYPPISAVRLKN